MCLLVLAWKAHPRYRLVVAANRDEFHARPAAPMSRWPQPNDMLAGRDLLAGGTWLALDRRRRFAVVTNFRDLQTAQPDAPSRGQLIPRYLADDASAGTFLAALQPQAPAFAGFNLLLADQDSLWYACNRISADAGAAPPFMRALEPGIHGLSNQFLDTPWPKLRRVRERFDQWLGQTRGEASDRELFAILDDRRRVAADEELPQTGLSPEWERVLSAPFVLDPRYGTRCSTVLLLEHSGAFTLVERRFDAQGRFSGESRWQCGPADWA